MNEQILITLSEGWVLVVGPVDEILLAIQIRGFFIFYCHSDCCWQARIKYDSHHQCVFYEVLYS